MTTVLDAKSPPESPSEEPGGAAAEQRRRAELVAKAPADPDEALRVAIKAAVDAGDTGRAMALLEVLRSSPKPAKVVDLVGRSKTIS